MEECLREGAEGAVIEFETVKKIIFVALPIFTILVALAIILIFIPLKLSTIYLFIALLPIDAVATFGLSMYLGIPFGKEFRFYLARACFIVALQKKFFRLQMHYFGFGLQEYNRYLKRLLKYQIKDIDKIFLKVSLSQNYERTKEIRSLSDSFKIDSKYDIVYGKESDKLKPLNDTKTEVIRSLSNSFETETDKLKPLRYISTELMLMKSEDIESFLVPESLKSRLKVVGTFLAASIPIVISIIALYVTITSHKPNT